MAKPLVKRHSPALAGDWLNPKATIVWEENAPQNPPAEFELLDQRRYGETWITLIRAP